MSKIDKLHNLLNLLLIVMAESNATPMDVAEAVAEATPMAVVEAEAVPSAEREKKVSKQVARMLEAREQARAKWEAHQQASLALEAQQRAEAEQQAVARASQHSAIEARAHDMIARLNAIKAIRDEAALQARNGQITASAMSRILTNNPEYTWKLREEQAFILMDIVRHGGTTEQFTTALTAFKIYRGMEGNSLIESGHIPHANIHMRESVMCVAMDNNRHDILEKLYSDLLIRHDALYQMAYRRGRLEEFRYLFSQKQHMSYGDYQAF